MKTLVSTAFLMICAASVTKAEGAKGSGGSKCYHPYLGVSVGAEQVSGRRTERVSDPTVLPAQNHDFVINLNASNRNSYMDLHGGILFDIPGSRFFIGPEVAVGRGHGEITSNQSIQNVNGGGGYSFNLFNRYKRHYALSGLAKVGIRFCQTYSVYASVGAAYSKLHVQSVFSQQNTGVLDPIPTSAAFIKGKTALLVGLGISKKLGNFVASLEGQMTRLGTFNFSYSAAIQGTRSAVVSFQIKPTYFTGMLRLSYHF